MICCSALKSYRARSAFSLIEVLIVLAACGLLTALLLPAFAMARGMARRTACTANLHQVGLATQMYDRDYYELPPLLSAIHPEYLSAPQVFVCPNDSQKGRYPGNDRLEGTEFLPSGVSYEYVPNWARAQELEWYKPSPRFGKGKWEDLTPLAGCMWHWAKRFDPNLAGNTSNAKGWQLFLTRGGAVRKVRVEDPVEEFTPEKYQ